MENLLKEAIKLQFDATLWPAEFIVGVSSVAVKRRLNIDSMVLAYILGTSVFLGKSQIQLEGSDKVEVASLWVCNIQVDKLINHKLTHPQGRP